MQGTSVVLISRKNSWYFYLRALLEWMKSDKKNRKEKINFTLLNGVGSSIINQEFTVDELFD